MTHYDVVIVGASFAGLTLAHHLPTSLRVLVVDVKPEAGSTVESTGLITTKTYNAFKRFFDIDSCITNQISSICVVSPTYDDFFVSTVDAPWIYQTDTKALVKALADTVPPNVEVRMKTVFQDMHQDTQTRLTIQTRGQAREVIEARVVVGADGSHSRVAQAAGLDRNTRFLFGYEQVFFGHVHLGPHPEETIYHYWFGEFSLGYGGWLSPTIVDGRPAFRIGLAKREKDRGEARALLTAFVHQLVERGDIRMDGEIDRPGYTFGSLIPIGGVLKKIHRGNVLLVGDAAGFCGAFAADGIKGSVLSATEGALLIERYINGDEGAFTELKKHMNAHGGLIEYYRRQQRYRWIWDQMRRNRTFKAMYDIIKAEQDTFLSQFCDSKDKHRSLAWTVLKFRHAQKLIRYSLCILSDMIFSKGTFIQIILAGSSPKTFLKKVTNVRR